MRRKSLNTAVVATLATLALATPVLAADQTSATSAQPSLTAGDDIPRTVCRPWLLCPPVPM